MGHALACALALACADDVPAPASEAQPKTTTTALHTEAHAAAYARLLPLAIDAFTLADPLAAAELGLAAPRVRPLGTGERVRLRETVDATWNEAEQIDADALGRDEAAVLRVVRFGLLRVRDDLERRPLTRTDPGVAIEAVDELVDALDRIGTPLDRAALDHAAVMLREGIADLGATSPESLQAARTDLEQLRARVKTSTALTGAIVEADTRLAAIAAALPAAKPASHEDRLPRAVAATDVRRLPARLGDRTLRRRLEVEESETRTTKALFADVLATASALATMRGGADVQRTGRGPVTMERCTAAWTKVKDYAATQPALRDAKLDCAAFVSSVSGLEIADTPLLDAIVHAGVVEPTRRARRRAELPVLALVGGRVAPKSHVHAQTLAVAAGMGDPGARTLALRSATEALCRAAVGLAVHGELFDDATLAKTLGPACEFPIEPWIADALAHPRASLDGIGLTLVRLGPADAVALERYWWLPIGLVVPTARPQTPAKTEPATKAVVEPLGNAGDAPQ